ncbi:MAG: hypothetical protein K6A64_06140 [Bacteroidales bacterium]|nr:hypothetical protein [Bacteroidales bacterium]
MKKILVVCAAITLSCFLVRAQEAEDTGSGAGLSVVSRLDAGLTYDKNEGTYFNFGNTSLYTLFEGNISENWSFTVLNHWIGADWGSAGIKYGLLVPTGDLYKNTINFPFTGKAGNSIFDEAHINFNYEDWEIQAGKMPLLVGGFEFEEYDFDVNPIATSTLWNSLTVYQYGASVSKSIQDGAHTFTAMISTNQCNNSPAFGFKWNGEIDWWSTSYSLMISDRNRPFHKANALSAILSLGNRFVYRDFTATIDYVNRAGDPLYNYSDIDGYTLLMTLGYKRSETVNLSARYCLERFHQKNGDDTFYLDYTVPNVSLQAEWFPMDGLRVQGCAGLTEGMIYAVVGATYTLDFKLW